jgi:hypothetical protein
MPAELVKRAALCVLFAFDNLSAFLQRDRALPAVFDFGPPLLWNDPPWEPIHIKAKIMKFAQVNVC